MTEAAAKNLFKLMAIKDEYEVARLYTDGSFAAEMSKQFQSYEKLEFHLAPPIMGRRGKDGTPRKSSFGPWMMKGFRLLAAMKGLRGTAFDLFGYSAERRMERQLLAQYEADLELVTAALAPGQDRGRRRAGLGAGAHSRLWPRQAGKRRKGRRRTLAAARAPGKNPCKDRTSSRRVGRYALFT